MPNIKKVKLNSTVVRGIKTRTKNIDEIEIEIQKIAPLWEQFYEKVFPNLDTSASIYAVYYHYESDAMGEFDVLIGTDELTLSAEIRAVTLEEGNYLMFPVKGKLPEAIVETWKKIWAYFEDESIDERRSFETDFEKYISKDEAEIYIGVNYF